MIFLQVLVFALALAIGWVVALFVHELGHATAAIALTRQDVRLQLGSGDRARRWSVGRLRIAIGFQGLRYGWTEYDRSLESRGVKIVVALCGPLATVVLIVLAALLIRQEPSRSLIWLADLGLIVANFRILVTSLLPLKMSNPDNPEEEWLSDSLDVWRLLKK